MYIRKDNIILKTIRENKKHKKIYIPSKHAVTRWTNILNEEIFNNKIHPFKDIEIRRRHGCHAEHIGIDAGHFVYGELSMNNWFWNKSEFIYTLAHEMVHQFQWMNYHKTDHGRTFMKWKDKLRKFDIPLGVEV